MATSDWEVEIAADEAALKTKLSALRAAGNGVEDIIFHPGVGFTVTYLRPTNNFLMDSVVNYDMISSIRFREPSDVTGMSLWVKSDTGITKNVSDKISNWEDQSVNGYDLSQSIEVNKPLLVDNQLNGFPTVKFSKANLQALMNNTAGAIFTGDDTPYTLFYVFRPSTGDGTIWSAVNNSGYSTSMTRSYLHTNETAVELDRSTGAGTWVDPNAGFSTNNWFYVSLVFKGTTFDYWVNGVNKQTDMAWNHLPITVHRFLLGAVWDGATFYQASSTEFTEFLIYDSALSNGDRGFIESYLSNRYGI